MKISKDKIIEQYLHFKEGNDHLDKLLEEFNSQPMKPYKWYYEELFHYETKIKTIEQLALFGYKYTRDGEEIIVPKFSEWYKKLD